MSPFQYSTRRLSAVPAANTILPGQVTIEDALADAEAPAAVHLVTTAGVIATAHAYGPTPAFTSLTADFIAFHRANDWVYGALRDLALNYLRTTGASRVGAQQVIEAFRWHTHMQTKSAEFKINNNHAS